MAKAKISAELREAKRRLYEKKDRTKAIKAGGSVVGVIMLVLALMNGLNLVNLSFKACDTPPGGIPDPSVCPPPIRRALDFVVFAILAFIGPYGFYTAKQQRNIRQIEKRLPDFLRDVAEAGRFGMTLAEAVVVASQGKYGKLTPEIQKMAAQIDWGVPATEALRLFAERVKTPMVERVVAIIIKSSHAGGDVADVLTMVSHDAKEEQLTQEERKINMSTYIAVIYISFMVFLVTIFILNATFLPKIKEASVAITSGNQGAIAASPLPTDIIGIIFSIQLAFFIATIVHAIGDGILAGVLDNGKIANGLRHSFFMLVIAVVGFMFV